MYEKIDKQCSKYNSNEGSDKEIGKEDNVREIFAATKHLSTTLTALDQMLSSVRWAEEAEQETPCNSANADQLLSPSLMKSSASPMRMDSTPVETSETIPLTTRQRGCYINPLLFKRLVS